MAKRPAIQFYPADWKANQNLRRCSEAARGVWMDLLCVFHDGDEYGLVRWPLEELARAAGAAMKLVRELVQKSVLKGAESNFAGYVHTPRHAGKDMEPVTLIAPCVGPVWFSSRMVRDEWVRGRRGIGTRFGDEPDQPPTRRVGENSGDGPTSSSSSTPTVKEKEMPAAAGLCASFDDFWKAYPTDKNMPKKRAREAWGRLSEEKRKAAIAAVPGFRAYCRQNEWYRPIYADRFLSQEKFEGYTAEPIDQEAIERARDWADRRFKRGKYAEVQA